MLCLALAVSLPLPLNSSLALVDCTPVVEPWALTLSVPLLESSGAKDSLLSVIPGGARGIFLLGTLPYGTWKTLDPPSSGMSPVSLGVRLLLLLHW